MILDFVDHYRTDARSCIRPAQRVHSLRGILRLPGTDDVTSETHSVSGCTKGKPIAKAGQISVRVPRIEIDFLAMGIEPETVRGIRVGVPIAFRENQIPVCRD